MDDKQRVALVETRTQGSDGSPQQLIRYQFGNHLGSASLELDDKSSVISYEEYFPYGSTSYQAVDQSIKAAAKRYRYTGMERDEESGLSYHGARYYAGWLARWIACDPIGIGDGINVYRYVSAKPTSMIDFTGTDESSPSQWEKVKIVADESRKASADRLRAFNSLVRHPIDTLGNIGSAIKERYTINKSGAFGDTPALAAVRAVDQVLDPINHAARHERTAQLADSRGQTEVALRERTQEAFSLGDAALLLEGVAKRKVAAGAAVDDATILREDPAISKSGGPRPKDPSPSAAPVTKTEVSGFESLGPRNSRRCGKGCSLGRHWIGETSFS